MFVNNLIMHERWVCAVVRSGYHNGARCRPEDPHDPEYWGCGYRIELSMQATSLTRALAEEWNTLVERAAQRAVVQ